MAGVAIYARVLDRGVAAEARSNRPGRKEGARLLVPRFLRWSVGGAVYGALIGLGVYILAKYDLWFLIGKVNAPNAARSVVESWPATF